MTVLSASEVRAAFSDTINRVAYSGERIVIRNHGKRRAAIVSMRDFELLERLEDHLDIATAKKVATEEEVPWDEVKRKLGL